MSAGVVCADIIEVFIDVIARIVRSKAFRMQGLFGVYRRAIFGPSHWEDFAY